jgi:DNA polymerase IV
MRDDIRAGALPPQTGTMAPASWAVGMLADAPISDAVPAVTGTASPWPAAILHLDLDAFFVGVHLLDHPEDRGRRVAVGGSPGGRGVVTSASYEARKFGVHAGMPASRALRACPGLKFVGADWARIRACSRQVMEILARFGPCEPVSVDEAYVDLGAAADPAALAVAIRASVVGETGLAASAGLATSKLVAKVASDAGKPGGGVVVPPGTEVEFLAPRPAQVLSGIGPRTAERLAKLGVHTCAELAGADIDRLERALGPHARRLPARAVGLDRRRVRTDRPPPKSISNERTFDRDVVDRVRLLEQVAVLSARVGQRLRRQELVAHTVFVKFRWGDFTTFTRQVSLAVPIDGDGEVGAVAAALWQAHWPAGRPVRLIGVGVGGLEAPTTRQLGLGLV